MPRRREVRFTPILRAWFPHEVRKIRKAINHTLQELGQATMSRQQ